MAKNFKIMYSEVPQKVSIRYGNGLVFYAIRNKGVDQNAVFIFF